MAQGAVLWASRIVRHATEPVALKLPFPCKFVIRGFKISDVKFLRCIKNRNADYFALRDFNNFLTVVIFAALINLISSVRSGSRILSA